LDEGYNGALLACLKLSGNLCVAESLGMGAGRQAQQILRVIDTKRSALACTFGPLMQPTVISWLLASRGVPNFFGIGGEMVFVWVNSHDSILRPLLRPPAGTSCDLLRTRRMQAPETRPRGNVPP